MIFRKAIESEVEEIWEILQYAIERRKQDGSTQWQDGYPNPDAIRHDIAQGWAYVIADVEGILAYGAVIFEKDPAYATIKGKWLTERDYVVVHRVASASRAKGMGIATQFFQYIETLAKSKNINSIKVDTNFDNMAMLRILEKLGYQYCGDVIIRDSGRMAFEKCLD
jgi:predicted GNAT superfamily acetyltransferase